jgi:23S rRNA (uracil1939-C5)-methyltransferase
MAPDPAATTATTSTVELEIAALDDFGRGAGDVDGVAVRVPFTIPGERVRARVWRRDAAGAEADLLEVLTPSPQRIAPACPLFGECGGCQLQHLPYLSQLEWKTSVVRRHLTTAQLDIDVAPCLPSPRAYGYRSKITPHHERPRGERPLAIGFLKVGRRHDVVDVAQCPLATEGINAHLPAFRAEIAGAANARRRGATFLIREAASGVTTDPDARVTERVGHLSLEFFAREFFQNNPFLLPRLVEFVVESAAATGAGRLVDTYSGSGLFALAAAARFHDVIGVEVSAGAIAAARENATRNGIANARFIRADSSRIFAELPGPAADVAVIIDPPRKGCDETFLGQLVAFAPRAIVYVSCNPESLARDLVRLTASGYRIRALQPFDMFPQTRHVECVAVLERDPTAPP